METLGTDTRNALILVLFGKSTIAQINTHLCTQTEETAYDVIGLQNSMNVHLEIHTKKQELF